MAEDLTPVLIGAGQVTQRDRDPAEALSPLDLMVEAARRAAEEAAAGPKLLSRIDSIAVVNILSWSYANPARLLAEAVGARPAEELTTTIGGNTPQWLVNETAAKILAGRVRVALLAGAEAFHTVRRAGRSQRALSWRGGGEGSPAVVGDGRIGHHEHEAAHGLAMPIQIYPLFENALRARSGRSIEAHQIHLGRLMSRFSEVAATNPYAWFRTARTAEDIAFATPDNRWIGFPYTKRMNAILDVDQGAAVLMASASAARELGVARSRWIHLWGSADAHDLWWVSERVNYWSSPALRAAGQVATSAAGLSIDEIEFFDLYSCFPSAVQIAREMLGIREDDPRPLTVTGGLPYHGGPGNNYSMHAIATMMERLRERPGAVGLVSALGWYLTKHSVGIYSAAPPPRPWRPAEMRPIQEAIDREEHPQLEREPRGFGTIETYTVLHDREGAPLRGIVIGRFADGRRFLANTPSDRSLLESLEAKEAVGRRGRVRPETDGTNRFDPD
jgi:acetyl-CoA C-acetyltransferase